MGPRFAKDGELGTSPELSDEMEPSGDGSLRLYLSSPVPCVEDTGVLRSYAARPIRLRLEGGIGKGAEDEGDSPAETVSSRE